MTLKYTAHSLRCWCRSCFPVLFGVMHNCSLNGNTARFEAESTLSLPLRNQVTEVGLSCSCACQLFTFNDRDHIPRTSLPAGPALLVRTSASVWSTRGWVCVLHKRGGGKVWVVYERRKKSPPGRFQSEVIDTLPEVCWDSWYSNICSLLLTISRIFSHLSYPLQ